MSIAQQDTKQIVSLFKRWWQNKYNQMFLIPPHCYKLKAGIKSKLDTLLKEYASQFAKDETPIGTTPLMEMTIQHRQLQTLYCT